MFGAVRGWNWAEKSTPPKGTSIGLLLYVYMSNFSFPAEFGGEIRERTVFFQGQKGEKFSYLPSQLTWGGRFFDTLYNFQFAIGYLKKGKFCVFEHSEPLP